MRLVKGIGVRQSSNGKEAAIVIVSFNLEQRAAKFYQMQTVDSFKGAVVVLRRPSFEGIEMFIT